MNIGFIGLGIMGEPMCANLIKKKAGDVFVFHRHPDKLGALLALGAVKCAATLELAEKCDVIITMVPRSEDSREVYEGVMPALCEGKTCIDMSTIDPQVSRALAKKARERGAAFIDAPVVKSRAAAQAGKLGIYVGGERAVFEAMLPVLRCMGENIKYMGENGSGLVMKLCHNALVSQIQNGVNEVLSLAAARGISVDDFAEAISYGGGANLYLESKLETIKNEDFTTAFSVANMHKDINLCLELAAQSGVSMPGENVAAGVYQRALDGGLAGEDFSATLKVVRGDI